jgi:hypothetical protein
MQHNGFYFILFVTFVKRSHIYLYAFFVIYVHCYKVSVFSQDFFVFKYTLLLFPDT